MPYQNISDKVGTSILNGYSKAAEYLQQRHDATIENASSLKTKLAELPLNEAESDWLQSKIDNVDTILDNVDIEGFKGYGYNDIVKLAGNVFDDEMLGKLKAQQNYLEFQDYTKKRTDIDQDTKDYLKEMNPYVYNPENNGNWQPNIDGVRKYTMDEIYSLAMKYITPEKGSINGVKYMNADGSITNKYVQGSTIGIYSTINGTYERVTEDKIKQALEAAMKADPGIRESLFQDYNVAQWKDNKNKDIEGYSPNQLLYNNDGTLKSFDDYVSDIYTPFVKAKAYYNQSVDIRPSDSWMKSLKIGNNNGSGNGYYPTILSNLGINALPGKNVKVKDDTIAVAQNNIIGANNNIRKRILSNPALAGIDFDLSKIDISNPEATYKELLSKIPSNSSENIINAVGDVYDEIKRDYAILKDDINNYNSLMENNPRQASEIALSTAIDNATNLKYENLDIDNYVLKDYGAHINRIFKNSDDIGVSIKRKEDYDKVIDTCKELGIPLSNAGDYNNKYFVTLNKENANYIKQFLDTLDDNITSHYRIMPYINGKLRNDNDYQNNTSTAIESDNFIKFYNRLANANNNDFTNQKNEYIAETSLYNGVTLHDTYLEGVSLDPDTDSKIRTEYSKIIDNDRQQFINLLTTGFDATKVNIEVYNTKNNSYEKASSHNRKQLSDYLNNSDKKEEFRIANNVNQTTGENNPVIILPKSGKEFIIRGLENYYPALAEFKYNPNTIAQSQINKLNFSNGVINFGFEKDNNGTYNNYQIRKDLETGNYTVTIEDTPVAEISKEAAIALRSTYNSIMSLENTIKSTQDINIIEEYLLSAAMMLKNTSESIFGQNIFMKNYPEVIIDMLGIK